MVAHRPGFASPNSTDCIAPLRCRTAQSGYRGVGRACKNPDGVTIYRAYVKVGGVKTDLGVRSPDPRVCARGVAAWYARRFGANWPAALEARKCNPWAVRYSPAWGGYVAAVWVEGQREEVCILKRKRREWRPTDNLAVFPTREAARAGIRRYLRLRYALLAEFVAWRPARVKPVRAV